MSNISSEKGGVEENAQHPMHETRQVNSIKYRKHRAIFIANANGVNEKEIGLLARKAKSDIKSIYPRKSDNYVVIDFKTHRDAVKFWNFVHGKTAAEIFDEYQDDEGFDPNRSKRLLISWVVNRETKEALFLRAAQQEAAGSSGDDEEEDDEEEDTPAPVPPRKEAAASSSSAVTKDDIIIGGQKPITLAPPLTPVTTTTAAVVASPPAAAPAAAETNARFVDTQKPQPKKSQQPPAVPQVQPYTPVGGYPLPQSMYTIPYPKHFPFLIHIGTATESLFNMAISNEQFLKIAGILSENNYMH